MPEATTGTEHLHLKAVICAACHRCFERDKRASFYTGPDHILNQFRKLKVIGGGGSRALVLRGLIQTTT